MSVSTQPIQITTVAEADAVYPRHSGPAMLQRRDGSILIAWIRMAPGEDEALPGNDDAPAEIVSALSNDDGRSWTDSRVLVERAAGDVSACTPALLRGNGGEVLFRFERYHRFTKGQPRSVSAYLCTSEDECETFSPPTPIFEWSAHQGSSNDVIQLPCGRLVVPVMHAPGNVLQGDGDGLAPTDLIKAGCFYSDDAVAWHECENYVELPMRGAMEPRIQPLHDGRLLMVVRTQLGSVFHAFSDDGGQTWTKAQTTGLQSPESCPGLVRLPETGDLVLIWNHSLYDPAFDHYGKRTPLSVAISKDDGCTWKRIKNIETDPAWEFTNPSALVTAQGKLMIAYEASKYVNLVPPGRLGRLRMHLKLAVVDVDWLYQ